MFVTWISSMWHPPYFPPGIYAYQLAHSVCPKGLLILWQLLNLFLLHCLSPHIIFWWAFNFQTILLFFCLMAGFETLNSTKSALREGLSVGSSLSVSFSFITILALWHFGLGSTTLQHKFYPFLNLCLFFETFKQLHNVVWSNLSTFTPRPRRLVLLFATPSPSQLHVFPFYCY